MFVDWKACHMWVPQVAAPPEPIPEPLPEAENHGVPGKSIATPWENHGNIMGNRLNIIGKAFEHHWKIMGKSGKSLETYG